MTWLFESMPELRGFRLVLPYGFASPLFGVGEKPNAWYSACCWPPGDRKGRIVDFDLDDAGEVTLLQPGHVIPCDQGDPWLNVFVWNKEIFVGRAADIWRSTRHLHSEIASTAPITMLSLAECGPPARHLDAIRYLSGWADVHLGAHIAEHWRSDVLLRGALVKDVRRFLGREHATDGGVVAALNAAVVRIDGDTLQFAIEDERLLRELRAYRPRSMMKTVLSSFELRTDRVIVQRSTGERRPKDFSEKHAHRMLLDGKLPPASWRPWITELSLANFRHPYLLPYLQNLSTLTLEYPQFNETNALEKLDTLSFLKITHAPPITLAPLSSLRSLRTLIVRDSEIKRLPQFEKLTNLASLDLMNCDIPVISQFSSQNSLQELNLTGTHIRDLSAFAYCDKLSSLDLWCTKVVDLTPLANLRNLRSLRLRSCVGIEDFSALAKLKELNSLDVRNTSIHNLRPLMSLLQLEYLAISRTRIQDLAPISRLKKLKYLFASSSRIVDLMPISDLRELVAVDISKTLVADLQALRGLANLKSLNLRGTKLTRRQVEGLKTELLIYPDGSWNDRRKKPRDGRRTQRRPKRNSAE